MFCRADLPRVLELWRVDFEARSSAPKARARETGPGEQAQLVQELSRHHLRERK